MLAVIHPIERLRRLAEVVAILASNGLHLRLHARGDPSDVVDDGFRLLYFPIGRLVIAYPRLVSRRKKKAEHASIPGAMPAAARRLRNEI